MRWGGREGRDENNKAGRTFVHITWVVTQCSRLEALHLYITHNELRDITAELITEVCHNVSTEPTLQPFTNEHLVHRTGNREDGTRLDVAAD